MSVIIHKENEMDETSVSISSVRVPGFIWLIVTLCALYVISEYAPISGTDMMENRARAGRLLSYIFMALCSVTYIVSNFTKANSAVASFRSERISVNDVIYSYEIIRKIVINKRFFESNIAIYFYDGEVIELNKMSIGNSNLSEIKKMVVNAGVNFVLR